MSTRSTLAGGPDSAPATLPSRLQNQAGSAEAADSTHGDSAHADRAELAEAADSTDADKAGCAEASDAGNADKAGFDEAAGAAVADKTGFVSVADATCESRCVSLVGGEPTALVVLVQGHPSLLQILYLSELPLEIRRLDMQICSCLRQGVQVIPRFGFAIPRRRGLDG